MKRIHHIKNHWENCDMSLVGAVIRDILLHWTPIIIALKYFRQWDYNLILLCGALYFMFN